MTCSNVLVCTLSLTEAFCESGEKSWVDWVQGVVSAGMSEEVLSLNNSSPLIIFSD